MDLNQFVSCGVLALAVVGPIATVGFPGDGLVYSASADQKLDASRTGDGVIASLYVACDVPTSSQSPEFWLVIWTCSIFSSSILRRQI